MTPSTPATPASALALFRNIPVGLSVWSKFRAQGWTATLHSVVRACPARPRAVLARGLGSRWPIVRAAILSAGGKRDQCQRLLRESVARDPQLLDAAVDILVAAHQPWAARRLAEQCLGRLRPETSARLLSSEGYFSRALEELGDDAHHRALAEVVQGELLSLDPSDRLATPATAVRMVDRPQRICHLVTTALPEALSGYTVRTHGIAQAQSRRGRNVTVVSRLGFPVDQGAIAAQRRVWVDDVAYERLLPARRLPLSADARLDIAVEEVVELVSKWEADVLHAHSKHDNAQVAIAAGRRLGIPVVYEARGFLEETWRSRGGSAESERYQKTREAETQCMHAADAVVTLSDSMREDIIARGVDAERIHLIPNAIADEALDVVPDRDGARRALGLSSTDRVVGLAGTLNAYEGLDVLIEAVALLDDPQVMVLIVGGGPQLDHLRNYAAAKGVKARFTGRVLPSEVHRYVAALDLYCLPRLATDVTCLVPPLKPLDALALSVPLLASDLPPLAEIVDSSGAGWTAEAGSPEVWAGRMKALLADSDVLAEKGRQGRDWVRRFRTWRYMAERYDHVYRAAVAAAGRSCEEGQ